MKQFLIASPTLGQKHNTDGLAINLNQLKEKSARYVSRNDFFPNASKNKLVRKI